MDPLSATLSLISLATTLADLLDLAIRLRESFQKISRNREDANRLASDIVSTLQQLKEFHDDHFEILDNSTSMKTAIYHLNSEMQLVYSRCCALIPISGAKKAIHWQKARAVFNSWINRSKVEEEIKELKAHVMLCYIQFTTFASARVEASTRRIYDITTEIKDTTTKIENRFLSLNRSQVVDLRAIGEQFSHTIVSNVDYQSLDRAPDGESTLIQPGKLNVADAYLRSEIATIDQTLKTLSRTLTYSAEKADPYQKPFRPIIHVKPTPRDLNIHRRDIIMKTLDILRILQTNPTHGLPFQQGGWDLINLSIGLYQMEHYPEATVTGLWAVNLFRILVSADPNVYHPYLALSLYNLSHYHIARRNERDALDAMTECVKINRILRENDSTPEVLGLLVRSLTSSAKISAASQDHQRSLVESEEAIKISEDVLGKLPRWKTISVAIFNLETCCSGFGGDLIQQRIPGLDLCFSSASFAEDELKDVILQTLHGYAQALHQFSYSLHHHGRFVEAIAADTKALQLFRFISFDMATTFESDIAEILYHLTHNDFRLFIPSTTSMSYIQESIAIYRRTSVNGSILYRKLLYHALFVRATMLRTMERYAEEVEAWNEVADLARSIQEGLLLANALYQTGWGLRHLNQFKDAAASRMESVKAYRLALRGPSHLEANAHYELAVDFELADLHEQAKASAQEAVNQYRSLVLTDHELCMEALADSLALLANIFLGTLDVDLALETGEEALRIYRATISRNPDPDIISKYMHCLDINMTSAFKSEDEEQAIERGRFVVELFEELSIYRTDEVAWGIVGSCESYGLLFNKYDHLSEARVWIEKAIEWYTTHPVEDSHQAGRFIASLCNYGSILDDQGFREQALNQIVKAVDLGKDFAHSNSSSASLYSICTAHQIDLLLELGRYREALEISEDIVRYAGRTQFTNIQGIVECLLAHATALNYNQKPEKAIDITNKAIEVRRTNSPASEAQKDKDRVVQLARAFHTLSESLADSGRENEALVYARQSVDQIAELQSDLSPLRWPHLGYMRALFSTNLSGRLAASGDYQGSIALLKEVRTFYETNVPIRTGYFIELARVLRLMGLLYCSCGQHDDGIAVLTSLTSLRRRLLEVVPDLAHHVDIYLRHEIRRPSWLISLHCSHQPSVIYSLS